MAAFGTGFANADPLLRLSQSADVQVNAATALARVLGRAPRAVEAAIVEHLHVDDLCSSVEISGPGFVNLTLRQEWLESEMQALLADESLQAMA